MRPFPSMSPWSRALLFCLITLGTAGAHAQSQVLFVNDNDNIIENTSTMMDALDAIMVPYEAYDIAGSSGVPPSLATMSEYDLVIWYTSTDGVDLNFWYEDTQVALRAYWQAGGKLWVIGQDLLYALYGSAPHQFETGDLAFDVLGIQSYDVQSNADDGGEGAPQMDLTSAYQGVLPQQLTWIFPTLFWADGCSPREEADAVYVMGPETYVLAGFPTMVELEAEGRTMSTFFDPALIATDADRQALLQGTIQHLLNPTVGVSSISAPRLAVQQDMAAQRIVVQADEDLRRWQVRDLTGALVSTGRFVAGRAVVGTEGLAPGAYLLAAIADAGVAATAKFVVVR